jgi:hypothetical protein
LSALAGIEVGTPEFEQYLIVAQTLLDSADSINWGAEAAAKIPVIHNQVLGDEVVPNVVAGAPLAGSEALNRIMGLASYGSTQANPDGLRGVARFLQPSDHESLFRPIYPAVTAEMQGQMASFIASGGTFVQVGNPDLLAPVIVAAAAKAAEAAKVTEEKSKRKKAKDVSRIEPVKRARD